MKKIASVAMALVVMSTPALGASVGRVATREYTAPNGMVIGSLYMYMNLLSESQSFTAKEGERWVTFEIMDQAGLPALGHVHFDSDGDGDRDASQDFCGQSEPISARPGKTFSIAIFEGECPDGTPAVATQGTVTATFTR